jgi:cell division protein YceG involved in septum cleavage
MRIALAGLAAAGVLAGAAFSLSVPQGSFQGKTYVEIPRGGSLGVARALADAGVVRYRWQFLAVRLLRPKTRLHAGEYLFDKPASVWRVFDRLVRGDP